MAGRLRRWWTALKSPTVSLSLGAALIIGAVGAMALAGGTAYVIHATGTNEFCANACHEMNISMAEFQQSPHFRNASGVTASCSQCHIPQASLPRKLLRKTQAGFKDVVGKITGVISTPEKFEAHRKEMAETVWKYMKESDSRECRYCHNRDAMQADKQKPMAQRQHAQAVTRGMTCIECHQGIAHNLPEEEEEEEAAEPAAAAPAESTEAAAPATTTQ